MLIFTGHATTSNALHNTITMLAIYPEYQVKMQEDLDRILGDREPDYENDYPALAESWAGAIFVCVSECLQFIQDPHNIFTKLQSRP